MMESILVLFALTPRRGLRIFTTESDFVPGPGWAIISMVAEPENNRQASDDL